MQWIVPPPRNAANIVHPKRRVVLTTLGSLGDLYPYVAIAKGLQARGHEAVIATSEWHRERVEASGLGFRAIRPNSAWVANSVAMRRFTNIRWGLLRVGQEWILPALRESYEDILAAAGGADLLVSHPLATFATRLVAEKTGIPWASTMPVPLGFFSAHDPSVLSVSPFFEKKLRCLGPAFWGPLFWLGKRALRFLAAPWYRLRAEIGLPPTREGNPLADSHSPLLVLALFSKILAAKQPDWPEQTVITGFPLYDHNGKSGLRSELARFLDDGPPPIVFTLGSAVATDPGLFYEHSVAAAKLLRCRAVLILQDARRRFSSLPGAMIACDYAPFFELFPRAAAVVHHGGIGTTGLAMRSGRPMLVMPSAWDQPDHAERATRLGVGRTIPRHRYTSKHVAAELRQLLDNQEYLRRALEIAEQVRKEDGVRAACDALETLLHVSRPASTV